MAGTRKEPLKSGNIQGWFVDHLGKQKFFTGTRSRKETEQIATEREEEQRKIRLGYLPPPTASDRHKTRPFGEVAAEYLSWGKAQGGHGGRPWGVVHLRMRTRHLKFWEKRLELKTLGDLENLLSPVEIILQELQADGRAGKTLQNYAESLRAFCEWMQRRNFLKKNPLANLTGFDASPRTTRRAMTPAELQAVLGVVLPHRRLLYEVAVCSGLRAGELRALQVSDLDTVRDGLWLNAAWTKNRKKGFQPMPADLVKRLVDFIKEGSAKKLYEEFHTRKDSKRIFPDQPLLYVPARPADALNEDLNRAKVSKTAPGGKLDFHAFRTAYVSFVLEAGAGAKEAQTLARHSTVNLTLNTYARTRSDRLSELTEAVYRNTMPEKNYVQGMHRQAVGREVACHNSLAGSGVKTKSEEDGAGVRIPHAPFLKSITDPLQDSDKTLANKG